MLIGAGAPENHWRAFAICWKLKTIAVFDSAKSVYSSTFLLRELLLRYVEAVVLWLGENRASYAPNAQAFNISEWTAKLVKTRAQQDRFSCGYHALVHLERSARYGSHKDYDLRLQKFADIAVQGKILYDISNGHIVNDYDGRSSYENRKDVAENNTDLRSAEAEIHSSASASMASSSTAVLVGNPLTK